MLAILNNTRIINIVKLFVFLVVLAYPGLGYSAGDPLKLINDGIKGGVSTFQVIALSIAGLALIVTALGGAFGRLDINRMLQLFSAIIIIAGAVLLVDWISGFIK